MNISWKPIAIPLAILAALAAPLAAISQTAPQVVFATAGSGGSSGGAINRYTIRFSEAMVPLGDPRATPPATIKCAVPSTGRWADTQTFVFEFERPLPGGISCDIKLRDNLASARGATVTGTADFMIDTGGPSVRAVLTGADSEDIEEDQVFLVATNTPATPHSISSGGYCAVDGIGERIPLDVLGTQTAGQILADLGDDDWESRNFLENAGLPKTVSSNVAERTKALETVTAVKCRRPLPPGKEVALVWGKNIAGPTGKLSGRDQRYDFSVRRAFVARWNCSRVNAQSGCNPVEEAKLFFTSDVPTNQAMAARITFADGTELKPRLNSDDKGQAAVSQLVFDGPLPAGVRGKLTLPTDLRDTSGRRLSNALRFPLEVAIAPPPPLVKFPANFGIIEANSDAALPVTVRAVEPALAQKVKSIPVDLLRVDSADGEVAKWLRDVEEHERERTETVKGKTDKDDDVEVNRTGEYELLKSSSAALKLDLPGKGKDFEVVGIPLTKPGFYVVELASPVLGSALLRSGATRYVTTAALVTNLAVHFKWGRETSLAWVTTLDGAKPVAGADIRVSDSCSGNQIARGVSDASGRLIVNGLPNPETYTNRNCEGSGTKSLMVSARAAGDFSFTMTHWGEGIAPYDFDLPFNGENPADLIHTVFDRKLVKQGEIVNMKHIARRPIGSGFAYGRGFSGTLKLTHQGSDTEFKMPITIGADGVGENSWAVPKGAPMGSYGMSIVRGKDDEISLSQEILVDEYRLPTMRATISGPKEALVRPTLVPINMFVGYLSGGPAGQMPVNIRTAYAVSEWRPEGWSGWSFGGSPVVEGTQALNGDAREVEVPLPLSQTIPLTLGGDGTVKAAIDLQRPIDRETVMDVEMDYQDANGETLTASRRISLHPAAIRIGVKPDGWMMRGDDLRLKIATIDHSGNAVRGRPVKVEVFSREILTARRRLIGGFYAYDNQSRTTKLASSCTVTTDKLGFATCVLAPNISGEVTVVATTTDANGNTARAVDSVWLAGQDDWWFGGDNGDRMDIVPEAKSYKVGETARVQVRMPFREATALVTVEREGVLSSFVTQLSGKDPVVEVKMPDAYAPNVYVSVMAVRGRVGGFKLWTAQVARDWGLPFLSQDGYQPTALVDLAKPSYRVGMAKLKVGWEGHKLAVSVKADKERYGTGDTANVGITVKTPGGKAPASAEIAFAAVDEALLRLKDNDSWDLIDAMMGDRSLDVLTSTAQTQVVGKRHYGKKAVAAGGGGGDGGAFTRNDFRPVLLWKGRVPLNAKGEAQIPVQLADSLSSYRLVAVANAGTDLFGTGSTNIRTAQDLSLFSGMPPLVRSGDRYDAAFTVRNTTDKPMTVTATAKVTPAVPGIEPKTITLPAGAAMPVSWQIVAPDMVGKLDWVVEVKGGKSIDRVAVSQDIVPLVPLETWAATLMRVGENTSLPVQAPAGALPGIGYVDVKLSDTLAPPLGGVRDYMSTYPYNCFEQQTSRFVTLDDVGGWSRLASEIPAYLDGDGLLRYWPESNMKGSPALTAYILSITSEAGFTIADDLRAKMLGAMKSVLDGRLRREYGWSSNDQYLRLSALAAMARNGAARPAMLGQITLAPADMPTTILAEWLVTIDRTKGANKALRDAAEAILRQRIVYEGTRLDLTDKANAPWWMMSSGDEMAIKALGAILGRPGWTADEPKMMVGTAARQQRGHWDTTTANAWGAVTARKFAKLYPASAITGITSMTLAGQTLTHGWPRVSDVKPMQFSLPATQSPLILNHVGAGPWATVSVKAAVPLRAPLFAGYRIKKELIAVEQAKKGSWTQGDVMKVRLTIDAGAGRNWVVVNDPVPPGATIMGNIGGQSQQLAATATSSGAYPSYVERGNDGWRGYYEWAPEGQFTVEYVVRINGTGQFNLPPTRVEAMYSPEIRGQLPNGSFSVGMR
jgi:alpha-2-macroglobulin